MHVLQHPNTKDIVGVSFEGNSEEDVIPHLVNFSEHDSDTFMLIKHRSVIQTLYDTIHIHYFDNKNIKGLWVHDYVCDLENIREYNVVGIADAIANFKKVA